MVAYNFLLCSQTPDITARDLEAMRKPLEINAQHCAELWHLPPPAVEIVDDISKMRSRNTYSRSWVPVVFVDSASGDPSLLAVHFADALTMLPAARVYTSRASGLHSGPHSVFESAAHEILEVLANPDLRLWSAHPNHARAIDIPNEICDPTQDTYPIAYSGTTWPAANFVTPEWFVSKFFVDAALRRAFLAAGHGFDYLRRLKMPGEVGPEGYLITRDQQTHKISSESRIPGAVWAARSAHELSSKQHPWSRSHKLGLLL